MRTLYQTTRQRSRSHSSARTNRSNVCLGLNTKAKELVAASCLSFVFFAITALDHPRPAVAFKPPYCDRVISYEVQRELKANNVQQRNILSTKVHRERGVTGIMVERKMSDRQ